MIKNILPATTKRVSLNTKSDVNANIRNNTIENLNNYKDSNEYNISNRIKNLDSEWDTERFLETNAATIVIASTILGLKSKKCWFLLTGTVGLFLLQHALQGWCPPIPIIRKMGIRTADEINNEKVALKMIRGDFSQNNCSASEILSIAEKQ